MKTIRSPKLKKSSAKQFSTLLFLIFLPTQLWAFHGDWDLIGHLDAFFEDMLNAGNGEGPKNTNRSTCGSPIRGNSGFFFWPETDISLEGRPGLFIHRTYNSHEPRNGVFGNGWSSFCESRLLKTQASRTSDTGASEAFIQYVLTEPDGKRYYYDQKSDNSFSTPKTRYDTLSPQSDGSVQLVHSTGAIMAFNTRGRITLRADRNDNALAYQYSDAGQLEKISDGNGRSLSFGLDPSGHIASITDHTGRIWSYAYDTQGNLVSRTDPLGGVLQYAYTAYKDEVDGFTYYQLTSVIDESGVTQIAITYNGHQASSYTIGENETTYKYNSQLITAEATDGVGDKKIMSFYEDGPRKQITYDDRSAVSFVYDDNGNITKYTDQLANEWLTTYNELGRITSSTDPLQATTTVEYPSGKPWPAKVISPSGRETSITYDDKGNPLTITDPAGSTASFSWNAQGDLIGTTDASGNKTTQTVNAVGLPTKATDPLGRSVNFQYDARGNVISIANHLGETSTLEYDALDRLVKQTNPLGHATLFSYDAASRLTQVTAPNNASVAYVYDTFGRLATRTDYDGVNEFYTYRKDNLLDTQTDKAGIKKELSYDSLKRLTRIRPESNGSRIDYQYNARGDLTQASSSSRETVNLTYDAAGRILSETNNRETIDYAFNTEGELTSQTALGKQQTYAYDSRGLLTTISNPTGDFTFQYDADGRRISLGLPNGSTTQYAYDAAGQLLSQQFTGPFTATFDYGYDAAGRMVSHAGDGVPKSYEYDVSGQLLRAIDSTGDNAYSHDVMGNHLGNGQVYDVANRLLEDTEFKFEYDGNGNLTTKTNKVSGAKRVFTWNTYNELLAIDDYADAVATTPNSKREFSYGPLGKRWTRSINGVLEKFVYSGPDRIGTLNPRNELLESNTFGPTIDEPLALNKGGIDYFYQANHQGSVVALTNSGQIVSSYQYGAYGATIASGDEEINPFRYTAREYEDSELYYYRARYHSPSIRRFISEDPIGFNAGDSNLYAYVGGNPISYSDPMGLCPWCVGGVIGGLTDIAVQLAFNGLNPSCINWKEVAIATAAGAAGIGIAQKLGKVSRVFGGPNRPTYRFFKGKNFRVESHPISRKHPNYLSYPHMHFDKFGKFLRKKHIPLVEPVVAVPAAVHNVMKDDGCSKNECSK